MNFIFHKFSFVDPFSNLQDERLLITASTFMVEPYTRSKEKIKRLAVKVKLAR